mmetsp:Transcript_35338/g.94103  ORF Transcript_35338/g.94103 Transcript_35338/m.94103 type:complete len:203 (-) Transcript_35338:602-1210(-)
MMGPNFEKCCCSLSSVIDFGRPSTKIVLADRVAPACASNSDDGTLGGGALQWRRACSLPSDCAGAVQASSSTTTAPSDQGSQSTRICVPSERTPCEPSSPEAEDDAKTWPTPGPSGASTSTATSTLAAASISVDEAAHISTYCRPNFACCFVDRARSHSSSVENWTKASSQAPGDPSAGGTSTTRSRLKPAKKVLTSDSVLW